MIKINILLLTYLLLIVGCTQSTEIDPVNSRDAITFDIQMEPMTKGSLVESVEQMRSIGVYCASTEDEVWSTSTTFTKMENERLDYDSLLMEWVYDGDTPTWGYISVADKYTFMAYSPYSDEEANNGVTPEIVDGNLVIKYVVPNECENQPDLMMALPIKDIYPQFVDSVSLNFKHLLSAIGFSVKGVASDIITALTIKNVVSSGEVTISDSGVVAWSLGSISDVVYDAIIDDSKQPNEYISTGITLDNGYLMMIPQVCDNVEVVIEIYNADSQDYTTKTLYIDGEEWQAGNTYNYTINISSYDYTITGTSNCYMLHPNGSEQLFYIPVEGRINTFWRDYADDGQTYKDMLSSSDEWQPYILWHDIETDLDGFSVERVTEGFTPSESVTPFCEPDFTTQGTRSAMKITLPADISEGNIVIAVEYNGQILWSWHLWITEYNPDIIAARNSAQKGVYAYTSTGVEGEVHRYDTEDLWATIYDDCFIMDRNLGARDCDYRSKREGVLHYQFGRKDPFPASNTLSVVTTTEACVTFAEAVQNPTTFYLRKEKEYSWSKEGLSYSNNYLWFDKNILNSSTSSGKSIFDPSPLGWQVPQYGVFTVMNRGNSEYVSSEDILVYNGVVKLPMTGYRSNNSGNVNDYGDQGNLRLSTQIDASSAYNLAYDPYIDKDTNNTLADGFCVRCIEE